MNEPTAKNEKALAALLKSPTLREAAKAAKISEATLWRLMQSPDFQRDYRAARRAIVENAVSELQRTTSAAVETLRRNLSTGNPSTEVRAAQIILEQSIRAVELVDLAERIEGLEALMAKKSERKLA